jgi:TonB-dependent SusC/RagA subfamily outer membrane receptor
VHAKELHSVDIILIQIACVVFWLNPFIWLYKREIQQNLEFIADEKAQEFSDCKKSYQLVLLKSSLPEHKFLITNNFYNSQIKKRIIMLHKSRSQKLSRWKYALILPVLALFLMSFNTKKVFIEIKNPSDNLKQLIHTKTEAGLNEFYNSITNKTESTIPEKNPKTDSPNRTNKNLAQAKIKKVAKKINIAKETLITVITKYSTDSELDIIKKNLKIEGLNVKFKNIKRNKSGEITSIKIDARSDASNAHYNMSSDEAITSIKIVFDKENNGVSIGNFETAHSHDIYTNDTESKYHKIHNSGNGSYVYVHSDYDHDDKHYDDDNLIISTNINNRKTKVINTNNGKVYVTSDSNDNEVIELILDNVTDETQKETIIINGKVKKSFEINDDKHEEIISKKNADRIYISGNGNKNPLYIIDGKEVSKDVLIELKPDSIESIEVLKGQQATEAYGAKGIDGVIVIKTKKKS